MIRKLTSAAILAATMPIVVTTLPRTPVTLSTSLTVPAGCSIQGATLGFGQSSGAAVSAQASVSMTCNEGELWTLSAGAGNQLSGGGQRNMSNGTGSLIPYLLYSDQSMLTELGDADAGGTYSAGIPLSGLGTGSAQSVVIYGLVPAFPSGLPAATYTDEVLLTVAF